MKARKACKNCEYYDIKCRDMAKDSWCKGKHFHRISEEKHYIKFIEIDNMHGKTQKFDIVRIDDEKFVIGEIWWDTGWRRYVWLSNRAIKWSSGCTKDVIAFIDRLMELRKEKCPVCKNSVKFEPEHEQLYCKPCGWWMNV